MSYVLRRDDGDPAVVWGVRHAGSDRTEYISREVGRIRDLREFRDKGRGHGRGDKCSGSAVDNNFQTCLKTGSESL